MTSFREELIEFARKGVAIESRCHNEECTKQYLVLPFVQLLGYDPKDPEQVAAEHSADFSDKYKNRVDYLLKADGVAAIALECKSCGSFAFLEHKASHGLTPCDNPLSSGILLEAAKSGRDRTNAAL